MRHTKPGASSASALMGSSHAMKSASSGPSTSPTARPMLICATWEFTRVVPSLTPHGGGPVPSGQVDRPIDISAPKVVPDLERLVAAVHERAPLHQSYIHGDQ